MADNGGNLKLTGQAFTQLRAAIKDLTAEAGEAKKAIESIFQSDHFDRDIGFFEGKDDIFIASIAKSFEALNKLVSQLNSKLAITSIRMRSVFDASSKSWLSSAKLLKKSGKSKGWWNNEGFDPFGPAVGPKPNPWKQQSSSSSQANANQAAIDAARLQAINQKTQLAAQAAAQRMHNAAQAAAQKIQNAAQAAAQKQQAAAQKLQNAAQAATQKQQAAAQAMQQAAQMSALKQQAAAQKMQAAAQKMQQSAQAAAQKMQHAAQAAAQKQQAAAQAIQAAAIYAAIRQQAAAQTAAQKQQAAAQNMQAAAAKMQQSAQAAAQKLQLAAQAAAQKQQMNNLRMQAMTQKMQLQMQAFQLKQQNAAQKASRAASNHAFNRITGNLISASQHRVRNNQAANVMTGGALGQFMSLLGVGGGGFGSRVNGGIGGGPGGGLLSKFGGTGALGAITGRFRVFQKPFPGSERNVFALGDIAGAFNNVVYSSGRAVQSAFSGITGSASVLSKFFLAIPVAVTSMISPLIGGLLGSISDLFMGLFDKLSAAISVAIGALTRLGVTLVGFATRAVEAASTFTEAVNAAKVVSGNAAANSMRSMALNLQREYGLSATDTMRGMGRIAGMLVQQGGFTQHEAGMQAQEVAMQLADIASVNNRNIEDLMRDMMSGLAGRFTPLRKNMLGFQAPVLDMMAKAKGINNPGLRTDLVARTQMFIEEFARQAGLFAGDLKNTRFEFANQRRKFLGGFEAIFFTIGRALEPFGKIILFAANELMDSLLNLIAPFGEDPMQQFPNTIRAFAFGVAWAKEAFLGLVRRIWAARDAIAAWSARMFAGFLVVTQVMVKFSIGVLEAGMNLINVTQAMGLTLENATFLLVAFNEVVVSTIDRFTAMFGGKVNREARQAQRDRIFAAIGKNNGKPLRMVEADILGAVNELKKIQVNPGAVNRLGAIWIENAKNAEAKAGKIAPQDPMNMAGRMVQYFDPARFRDHVQEREMSNAQERTADAAERILEFLAKPKSDVASPLTLVPPVGIGAMGVLEGMKRVAKP